MLQKSIQLYELSLINQTALWLADVPEDVIKQATKIFYNQLLRIRKHEAKTLTRKTVFHIMLRTIYLKLFKHQHVQTS